MRLALFVLCLLLSPQQSHAVDITMEEWTLPNGLRVILLPNAHQRAVSHRLWVKAGGADDPAGRTGLAHYVEHMMFSGTPKNPGLAYSETIASLGGQENAFTSWDYTAYHALIAKEHLPTLMALEADRIEHMQLSPELVERERNVILEERASRVSLSPEAKLREALYQHSRIRHPYRRPIIGWDEDINAISIADLQRFYMQYMHAANMVLVVAGNISKDELVPLVERHYGRLPSRAAPSWSWIKEPDAPNTQATIILRDATVQQPVMKMLFPIPSMHEVSAEHAMGYYMMAHLLGGGSSSILHKALVEEQQLAVNVGAYADPARVGPAEMMLRIVPRANVSRETLERAVLEILASTTFDEAQLKLAKDMMQAEKVYALDSLDGLARWVGEWVSAGLDLTLLTDWSGWLARTKLEHLNAAMKELHAQPAVTGWLLPMRKGAEDAS